MEGILFLPNKALMRSESGQKYTRRLFVETSYDANDKTSTIYTLRDEDHPQGYKSLYKLYMEEGDLTEHRFASQYLLGWSHWQILTESDWFKPYLARWREELRQAKRSEAISAIEKQLTGDKSLEAAKALLALTNPAKESKKSVGRPIKEKSVDLESQTDLIDDLTRINGE